MPADKWWEKYVGTGYVEQVYDCAELVIQVNAEVFNRRVYLPVSRKDYTIDEICALMDEKIEDQFEVVETPETGDMVLINIMGRDTHVGIYIPINGIPHVLHALERIGVVLTKQSRLDRMNCRVARYYRPRLNTETNNDVSQGTNDSNTDSQQKPNIAVA